MKDRSKSSALKIEVQGAQNQKHTPGPWKFHRTHTCDVAHWYVITDAEGFGPIVDVGGHDRNGQIAEAKYLVTDQEIIEANARLIAAAPELLEACKALLPEGWDDGVMDHIPGIKLARLAIAKAEGR
jgi:hypothetical protein